MWNVGTATIPFTGNMDPVGSVAFSPDHQRITPSERGSIRIPTDFTDHTIINDEGWICGGNGELLAWIPLIHRAHLHQPSNLWVAGEL
ncbi:hypothetical protein EDB87DRAFT_1587949 [Lactarius vividus]|nr:hypothetical protein EDB87DRAFT_1587949 [Lactarius vividus]